MKIGDRVGAIFTADPSVKEVKFFGYGVYAGNFLPDDAVGFAAEAIRESGGVSPRLDLDNGEYVWGCECSFGSLVDMEKRIAAYLKDGWTLVNYLPSQMRSEWGGGDGGGREDDERVLINVYAQPAWHEDAILIGTLPALRQLQYAVSAAIEAAETTDEGQVTSETGLLFASDGEGYKIIIGLIADDVDDFVMSRLAVPYTGEMAREQREDALDPKDFIAGVRPSPTGSGSGFSGVGMSLLDEV